MVRRLLSLLVVFLLAFSPASPKKKAERSSTTVKKEQQATKNDINQTKKKIKENKRQTSTSLVRLGTIRSDIARQTEEINRIRASVDSLDRRMTTLNDSIAYLVDQQRRLQISYIKGLRAVQGELSATGRIAFILSSGSFREAMRRVRYVSEFSKWRRRQNQRLAEVTELLGSRRSQLATAHQDRTTAVTSLDLAKAKLQATEHETEQLVAQLQREGSDLQQLLKQQEARRRALDKELSRMIAADQERQRREREKKEKAAREKKKQQKPQGGKKTEPAPAQPSQTPPDPDVAMTGSFESNKGRLPYPVPKTRIDRPFGRSKHPDLKNVYVDNPGIDIETSKGASVKAVFKGTVSAIFQQDGYNWIIMVRHGRYLTIYANVVNIRVRTGQEIAQGAVLGSVYSDPANGGRSILHFEVRRERDKQNPSSWLR